MSSVNLKFSDLIAQYSGDGDFVEWVDKFELVVKLQAVKEPEKLLPLFLTAGAFAVYQTQSDATKGSFEEIKKALTTAFSSNCFDAYDQLRTRHLKVGESVDSYVAELTRLVGLVCTSPDDGLVKCAFVCGLPESIQKQIQASCSVATMTLSEVVGKARNLLPRRDMCLISARDVTHKQSGARRRVACFECGSEEHMIRNCPKKKGSSPGRFCFVCGEMDHLAPSCSQRKTQPVKNE